MAELKKLYILLKTKDSLLKTEDILLKTEEGLLKTEDKRKQYVICLWREQEQRKRSNRYGAAVLISCAKNDRYIYVSQVSIHFMKDIRIDNYLDHNVVTQFVTLHVTSSAIVTTLMTDAPSRPSPFQISSVIMATDNVIYNISFYICNINCVEWN